MEKSLQKGTGQDTHNRGLAKVASAAFDMAVLCIVLLAGALLASAVVIATSVILAVSAVIGAVSSRKGADETSQGRRMAKGWTAARAT